jgi:hypothetical protein
MVKEEVPRMNTTTTPTSQRLEQALETFVEDLEGLEGAVQRFEEALLKLEEACLEPEEGVLEEAALKEEASAHQIGPILCLVGQEGLLSSANEPVPVDIVTNEPAQTGDPTATEPPSEAGAEANADLN